MGIKAIETIYNGYRFRSRLEARWAVFFDALGIAYEYEPEGYDLGEVGWYLPDFWLPQVEMFAEVKPRHFSQEEMDKCKQLALRGDVTVIMLDGAPKPTNYWAFCRYGLIDYVLVDSNQYHLSEGRFYASTGLGPFGREYYGLVPDSIQEKAITKARQARFEHGQRG